MSSEEKESKEQISYLVKLFGLSEFKIKKLVEAGLSLGEIEQALDYQTYESLLNEQLEKQRY